MALRITVVLFVSIFCFINSEEEEESIINDRTSTNATLRRLVRAASNGNRYSVVKSSTSGSTVFGISEIGLSTIAAAILILAVAFFVGCLVCPNWRLSHFSQSKASLDKVEGNDLPGIHGNFSENVDVLVVCNPFLDNGKSFNKIRNENAIAHSNPCFSLDEVTKDSVGSPRALCIQKPAGVHKESLTHFSRSAVDPVYFTSRRKIQKTSPSQQLPDSFILVNKHLHGNYEVAARPAKLNKENRIPSNGTPSQIRISDVLSTGQCSRNFNLFNFYNNTEYLNKTHLSEVRNAKRPAVLCDTTNSRRATKRFEENGRHFRLQELGCNLSQMYSPNLEQYPKNLNDKCYDMNDVAFKNMGAR